MIYIIEWLKQQQTCSDGNAFPATVLRLRVLYAMPASF